MFPHEMQFTNTFELCIFRSYLLNTDSWWFGMTFNPKLSPSSTPSNTLTHNIHRNIFVFHPSMYTNKDIKHKLPVFG